MITNFANIEAIEKHAANEKKECNCHEEVYGKINIGIFSMEQNLYGSCQKNSNDFILIGFHF